MRVREVGGGFVVGQDSDLLMRMQGKHIIQAEIHTCLACRYSGFASDFLDRNISDPMVERYFREFAEKLEPKSNDAGPNAKPEGTPLPHLQYYWSAQLSPLIGLTPKETGMRMLRAYWCLRLAPSSSLPDKQLGKLDKLYLRQAIAYLRKALRHEKDRTLIYLVAELCRRNRSFVRAANYFQRFVDTSCGPSTGRRASTENPYEYLLQAAEKLREAVRREDSTPKTMEELLYPRTDESDSETPAEDSANDKSEQKNKKPNSDKSRKADGGQ